MAFLRLSLTSVGLSARIGSGRNRLAATAADGKSDEVTFQVCMVGCGRAHAWPLALRFFQDMASFNVKQTTAGCNAAMAACEKGHAWEIALRLLEFEDLVDTPSYNSAISACGKGRQWRWALVLEGDMTEKELVPDAITHNSLMTALERGAQWQRALREIAAAQVPSNVAYNAAISSCGSSIMWRHALGLLHELRQRKGAGLVAFNAAMTSCAKGRHVREALQLFDEIQATDLQPDIVSFGAALTACEKGGLWEEAIYILLVRLQAAKVKPNVVLLNAVASACEKGRHWPGALWILHQAACRHRLRPDGTTINAAMAACLRGDQWPRALTLFAEMRRLSLASLTSYSEGLLSLQQARRWEDALLLLDEMFNVDLKPDLKAVGAALGACALAGSWQQACRLLSECRDLTGAPADAVAVLLTLASLEQAGLVTLLFGVLGHQLQRVVARSIAEGNPFGAPASAANILEGIDGSVTARMVKSGGHPSDALRARQTAKRALWQTVYAPTVHHFKDMMSSCHRAGQRNLVLQQEWSSFEALPCREAVSLLGFCRPHPRCAKSQ
ncbi:unnamed protein product, partial [Symbiodinium microadriaticum]